MSMGADPSMLAESVYVVGDDVSPAAITSSLQALLRVRRQPMPRRRFTLLDTFDGRVARAGGHLTRAGVDGAATLSWQPRDGRRRLEIRPGWRAPTLTETGKIERERSDPLLGETQGVGASHLVLHGDPRSGDDHRRLGVTTSSTLR